MCHCDSLFSKQVNIMYIMGENGRGIHSTILFWIKMSSMTDCVHDSCMSIVYYSKIFDITYMISAFLCHENL